MPVQSFFPRASEDLIAGNYRPLRHPQFPEHSGKIVHQIVDRGTIKIEERSKNLAAFLRFGDHT